MKKQHLILGGGALILFVLIFFFGKTTESKPSANTGNSEAGAPPANSAITTDALLAEAKKSLNTTQLSYVTQLENSVVRGDVKQQQMNAYRQLAHFWGDSVHQHILELYYHAAAAKLENSEKSTTFAAHLLLDELMVEENPGLQQWLGLQAKELFEKALEMNPANDSSIVGLGACYMFGNVSDNPMEGIMKVRTVAEKHPDNLYAQMILGLGGVKSGQFDKAIERFSIIIKKQPDNLEAMFHLAEAYERKGDKVNAIKWYKTIQELIPVPEAKKEIAERIKTLQ